MAERSYAAAAAATASYSPRRENGMPSTIDRCPSAQFVVTAPITAENAAAFSASVKLQGRNMQQRISSRETSRAPKRCVSPSARVVLPAPGRPRRTTAPSGRPITPTRLTRHVDHMLGRPFVRRHRCAARRRRSDVSAWRQSPGGFGASDSRRAKEPASSANLGPGRAFTLGQGRTRVAMDGPTEGL